MFKPNPNKLRKAIGNSRLFQRRRCSNGHDIITTDDVYIQRNRKTDIKFRCKECYKKWRRKYE